MGTQAHAKIFSSAKQNTLTCEPEKICLTNKRLKTSKIEEILILESCVIDTAI